MLRRSRLIMVFAVSAILVPLAAAEGGTAVTAAHARLRALVAAHRIDPPSASRQYALLAVAQERAIAAVWPGPGRARQAALGASRAMLAALFPDDETAPTGHGRSPYAVGIAQARALLAQRASDGYDLAWDGVLPSGPGIWHPASTPAIAPLRPRWGEVDAWFIPADERVLPPPPPAFGSPEFLAAVAEVRWYSDHRTPEQIDIARFWADGAGTPTPPGHWNQVACDLIDDAGWGEARAAAALSLTMRAVMDAGVCVWCAKYQYWLLRPSQADPGITLVVGLPNFPAYTSGHAGFSGAASEVLAYLFPTQASCLRAMAEEAAMSRIYAGIHYRFDSELGLWQGRRLAEVAIEMSAPRCCD